MATGDRHRPPLPEIVPGPSPPLAPHRPFRRCNLIPSVDSGLTVARDMTKERAEEFQILCSAALYDPAGTPRIVVGCGQPGQDSLRPYGLSYDALMRLAHHRLIIGDMGSRINFSGSPLEILSIFSHQGETWVLRSPTGSDSPATTRSISGILFTPAGQELFRVVERIPVPAYTQAMFEYLEKEGWTAIPFPPPSKAHNT